MSQIPFTQIPLNEYHPGEEDMAAFKYFELGEYKNQAYVTSEPHRHGYYEIFFFEEAEGTHMIDFEPYPIHSYSLHFVSPGQVHLLNRTGSTRGKVLLFTEEFFYFDSTNRDFLRGMSFLDIDSRDRMLKLDAVFLEWVKGIIASIKAEYQSNDPNREGIIRSYINILLLKCKSKFPERVKPVRETGVHLVVQFRNLIDARFTATHRVSDYAEKLSVSANHLNDVVKKTTGRTAGDLIQERVILEAKRLMLYSMASAKEIAYTIGFHDPAYFSRFFKHHTGQSPDEYRVSERLRHGLVAKS
ncbi:MAG: helix-turn-helix domain-containing protein [Bacteroidia bacterium]|jgi:AraC-like DNA-binding protein|nr:helix-turn-helix domain-containing protein [Bacteroidia bacterium]